MWQKAPIVRVPHAAITDRAEIELVPMVMKAMSVLSNDAPHPVADVDPHALLRELAIARQRVQALEAELKTRDELLASVAHELKTPLNAIVGWVRMLRGGTLAEAKRERALETIERSAAMQTQLIEDLVDVSRLVSGTLHLEKTRVAVASVIDSAVEGIRRVANDKNVKIEVAPVEEMDPMVGDLDRLHQVVWNLLSNAVKFTDAGGLVRLSARRREGSVDIVVSDDGRGLAPEAIPTLFQGVHRLEPTSTTRRGRIALGLAIVRYLVDLHGGEVHAESAGLGCGSTFTVSLPLCFQDKQGSQDLQGNQQQLS